MPLPPHRGVICHCGGVLAVLFLLLALRLFRALSFPPAPNPDIRKTTSIHLGTESPGLNHRSIGVARLCSSRYCLAASSTVSRPLARSAAFCLTSTSGSSPRLSIGLSRNPPHALTGNCTLYRRFFRV